ncbi:DUF2935 domain-containing protein [Shimazuella sp. AN120528]|uniref:DUF2935 domain-containing protein n=1 Tax=Shimazuella soli TaxID=1892854 RepID=UPI001F104871|nr:DUF2935 domain-containing protein [Shimazuella soli]MCH5584264.1 DUF2935 domain-containing protein [Shimazuella soli]
MDKCYISPWEEHQFWLKILDDHAHFVRDYLSPAEKEFVRTANQYIEQFRYLRRRLKQIDPYLDVSSPELIHFAREVHPVAYGYFALESNLEYLRLRNKVNLNLTPSFLTGTLLENQEYLRILGYFSCGKEAPPLSLVQLLDLWLEDQAGHAELLANGLDPLEGEIIAKSQVLSRQFISFLFHNRKIAQMEHFTHEDVPQQKKFVHQIIVAVNEFNQLVIRVLHEYKDNQLLSRLTYRFLEHHLPETCYFLKKLSCYVPNQADIPDCMLIPPYFNDSLRY